jgi:N-acetylneuraminic acid mutarotase
MIVLLYRVFYTSSLTLEMHTPTGAVGHSQSNQTAVWFTDGYHQQLAISLFHEIVADNSQSFARRWKRR